MILEFKIYELKKDTDSYKGIVERMNVPNKFIVVGEEIVNKNLSYFKTHPVSEKGISLIDGLNIDEFSIPIQKEHLKLRGDLGIQSCEFNIPKKYLTLDIVDNIQNLNAI